MISLHVDSASEVLASGDAIDPGNRVFNLGARLRERDELIDAVELDPLVLNLPAHDRAQAYFGPGNKPGET